MILLATGKILEVYLDFVWALDFYWREKLHPNFFSQSLPFLGDNLRVGGFILLPLQSSILVGVLRAKDQMSKRMDIGFVSREDSKEYKLVHATNLIKSSDQEVFDKRPEQENYIECKLQDVNSRINNTDSVNFREQVIAFHRKRELEKYAFIKLSKREIETESHNETWM
jgi:hypothetical protein